MLICSWKGTGMNYHFMCWSDYIMTALDRVLWMYIFNQVGEDWVNMCFFTCFKILAMLWIPHFHLSDFEKKISFTSLFLHCKGKCDWSSSILQDTNSLSCLVSWQSRIRGLAWLLIFFSLLICFNCSRLLYSLPSFVGLLSDPKQRF